MRLGASPLLALLAYLFLFALPAWLAFRLRHRRAEAVGWALFLLVMLPATIRLDFEGGLPALTVHRLILAVLAAYWLTWPGRYPWRKLPCLGLFIGLLLGQIISSVFSTVPMDSFKQSLSVAFEMFALYAIMGTLPFAAKDWQSVLRRVALGYGVVALAAFGEKYLQVNIFHTLLGTADTASLAKEAHASYTHRIMLGYGMALGLAVSLGMHGMSASRRDRWFYAGLAALNIGGCYFSNSRGPWLGLILVSGTIFLFGPRQTRSLLLAMLGLALITLALRPGIRDTLLGLTNMTFESETLKGKSYSYRWQLWQVAAAEVNKSPVRFLFGYGGGSTDHLDLSDYFEPQAGGATGLLGHTSFDNQYASDLLEFGWIGLLLRGALYLSLGWFGFRTLRLVGQRGLAAGLFAVLVVVFFAGSNVSIFAPQIMYAFWASAGLLVSLRRLAVRQPVDEEPAAVVAP